MLTAHALDVKSLDPTTHQPVAYADQLTVTDPLSPITVAELGLHIASGNG